MKKCFVLIVLLATCFSLFGEGISKGAHLCSDYQHAMSQTPETSDWFTDFIPAWFEHLEFADNDEESGYNEEFLQEHGGRVGTIILWYGNYPIPITGCTGTLIGQDYFLTAGHCAVENMNRFTESDMPVNNIGVLFGYQLADLEDDDDDSLYPRVSLHDGYLDEAGHFKQYGEPGGYSDYTEHPSYFPLVKDFECNIGDGAVEHGWGKVCWVDEKGNKIIRTASEIKWSNGQTLGEMDYAIYKLGINSNDKLPFDDEDSWPWESENNQTSQDTLAANLILPWQLPDNSNGLRGWERVNTGVLQPNLPLNIIGTPGYATDTNDASFNYKGLKVVNAGKVSDGAGRDKAIRNDHEEDILIFKDADIQRGHSGSPIIDDSGRVAGVVVWTGCKPGGANGSWINLNLPAENYATPMWKICRASKIIKDLARDQDCNGTMDWWDLISNIEFDTVSEIININGLLIDRFGLHPIPLDLVNYWYDMDQKKVITETKELPAYTYQVISPDNGDLFYVAKQNGVFYLFQNGTSLGAISNYPDLFGSSALVKGSDIYLAGGNLSIPTPMLPGSGNNSFQPYITKISSDGQNGYNFSVVATFPENLEDIRIFELGNDIYVSGNTTSNFAVYKLVANNQSEYGYSLSLINSSQPVRKDYNLTASDGKIIVSGGATDYISTVLNLDEEDYPSTFAVFNNIIMLEPAVSNNWVTVAENINDKLIMMSVTAIEDGKLIIVNPFISVGNSMQKIVMDLSEIPINGEHLRVDFEFDPLVYCLAESEETFSGGIGTSGECVPFTHPWYSSFSAGATVYSLSGKGDRLYVGTNNAIKVYDISDPISPVLVSSFSTSSRVNDLEVYGDTLFAATNGGLYKLDASDPDELTQILFVSAFLNSQYKVEVYNGKLYVGDDNGIKVRDLETLSVLTSVNNGSVLDFAIENGEIGLYKDALFSPVEIRDAETLTLKANEFFGCFEIEVGSSDGRFYLSCDDETYRFEDDGDGGISFTELSGDIRELQDVYTFDGYTYFYDENTIWISTSNDVPAICGNGIVESGEVCDGDSVKCTAIDSDYIGGTAVCNSTCSGYDESSCEASDGWF